MTQLEDIMVIPLISWHFSVNYPVSDSLYSKGDTTLQLQSDTLPQLLLEAQEDRLEFSSASILQGFFVKRILQEILLNNKIAIDQRSSGLVEFIAGQYLILGNT